MLIESIKKQFENFELKIKANIDENFFHLYQLNSLGNFKNTFNSNNLSTEESDNLPSEVYLSPKEICYIKTRSCSLSNFGVNLMLRLFKFLRDTLSK